jgi:hypothetical protein
MVLPARLATIHRATHTAAVVLVHALCGGQTIQNQPPKHSFIIHPPAAKTD